MHPVLLLYWLLSAGQHNCLGQPQATVAGVSVGALGAVAGPETTPLCQLAVAQKRHGHRSGLVAPGSLQGATVTQHKPSKLGHGTVCALLYQ